MAIIGIKRWLLKENTLVFLFCLAVISGPAIAILFAFDLSQWQDCYSYMGLAHFDLDQNPVRRFRIIVPFTAGILNYLFSGVFNKLAPAYFKGDFGLPFSFFVVNSFLMSYLGVLIYRYCKVFVANQWIAIIGVLTMLTCRYTAYTAGLPMTDSLYYVVAAMTVLGIKEQNTAMLIAAIFIGPFAKEAFIFIAPLIFFCSHISKKKLIVYFIVSGMLVFGFRYICESYWPSSYMNGLEADLRHIYNPSENLRLLFNVKAVAKILMNVGVWGLLPLVALFFDKTFFKKIYHKLDKHVGWFMLSVLIQLFVSGAVDRMFYIGMPVICLIVAISANELKNLYMKVEK